jgi:hypothetical protein
MKNQIFKTIIHPDILWEFLKNNGEEYTDYYVLSKNLYKKALFRDTIVQFTQLLNNYYYDSKKYYITRKMDYIKFITVIRQICNSINIKYNTQLVYNNSTYEIDYHIYKPECIISENV